MDCSLEAAADKYRAKLLGKIKVVKYAFHAQGFLASMCIFQNPLASHLLPGLYTNKSISATSIAQCIVVDVEQTCVEFEELEDLFSWLKGWVTVLPKEEICKQTPMTWLFRRVLAARD